MTLKAVALCLLMSLSTLLCVFAQEIKDADAQENLFQIGSASVSNGVVRKYDNRYEGIKGSPFFINDWLEGTVITNEGRELRFPTIKYDAYEDELIIKQSNANQYYFPKNMARSFTLNDRETGNNFHFCLHQHFKRGGDQQFYRVVLSGKTSVVQYTKVIFEKANFQGAYSNDKRYDEFKQYTEWYYFSEKEPQPKKLKRSAKGLSSIYPQHQQQIKNFILNSGFDCRKENDLLKILSYIQNIE